MRPDSQKLNISLHLFSWAILFCIPFIGRESLPVPFLVRHSANLILLIIFFYLNMYVLIPRFLFEKRIGLYSIIIILLIVLIVAGNLLYDVLELNTKDHSFPIRAKYHTENKLSPPPFLRVAPSLLMALMVFGLSTSLRVINEYLKKEKNQKDIENERLNSELSFLKTQINPHFLFNTLNNIYGLANIQSPSTGKAILKLADLMRYMLEDTLDNKVELNNEIDYIQTYLDLQRLRLHEMVKIKFNTSGDYKGKQIEPLLLIPFIENPFKHAISYNESSYINIDITVSENKLFLQVENSIPVIVSERDNTTGIGLNNVKKRLQLLYPEKHYLKIDKSQTKFSVYLEITI